MVRCLGLLLLSLVTAAADEWQAPEALLAQTARDRHTCLLAHWDGPTADADFGRGMPLAGGFGTEISPTGRQGGALRVATHGGHLHYRGEGNCNLSHGTLRLSLKGPFWAKEEPTYLWEARSDWSLRLVREPGKLALQVVEGSRITELALPLGEVPTDPWQTILASWDQPSGRAWLALGEQGVTGELPLPTGRPGPYILFVASGSDYSAGLSREGMELDELQIWEQSIPTLTASQPLPDEEDAFLALAEARCRLAFDQVVALQRDGGWATLYSYPTTIGAAAQGRSYLYGDDYISNDKSHATPHIGAYLYYAGDILGNQAYQDAALRAAELLLNVQDARGFWSYGYRAIPGGAVPMGPETMIKLQDSDQSHPIYFLAYLHRVTGDERYLASLLRAGAFYLSAQNPNGSWPHHWNAVNGIGENAIGEAGAGELNDSAANDAINIMVLLHHLTGERSYLAAIQRTGHWLLEAQVKGATVGWADQYDAENNPQWARHFEPPAVSRTATQYASQALLEIYRLSGDDRYLQPIRDAVAWLEQTYPDDQVPDFIDPASGRPIASWNRKIYYLDDPAAIEFLNDQALNPNYLARQPLRKRLESYLAGADLPRVVPDIEPETMVARVAARKVDAEKAILAQHESGLWISPIVADFIGSLGQGFAGLPTPAARLLRYIENARMVKGELPIAWRGDVVLRQVAWPFADWYEVAWPR